jgi:threonine dehydratase
MKIKLQDIENAEVQLRKVVLQSPLQFSKRLSDKYNAKVYLKREDLQEVRSFKIRGAFNKMSTLTEEEKKRGVVCASAGNHAQGVAYSCSTLKIKGVIFMPVVTPNQKIEKVKQFGGNYVEVRLVGNTYDEASKAAKQFCAETKAVYVHPFDDPLTIAGQGTVGKEIYDQLEGKVDCVVVPIGGGGLISGVSSYLKQKEKQIAIIGAEPNGSPSMYESLQQGRPVSLAKIDTFVDGAAVQTSGEITYTICRDLVAQIQLVPEGKICMTMIELYQNEGIIAEPAGAMSIAALDSVAKEIKGKTVVCVLSGGNNDISRYPDIMERSLVYQGLKHYFIIEFTQKPGQLRTFVDKALGPTDDIVRFEYMKKTNKEKGAALVGIELKKKEDLDPLLERMRKAEINFTVLSDKELLYSYII